MSKSKLVKWRVYCNTEAEWTEGWIDEYSFPDRCFTDITHDINLLSFQEIIRETITVTKIVEEEIPTGGFFRSQGFKFEVPANSTESFDVSWKYPIGVLTSNIQTTPDDLGNVVEAVVGPDTIIGVLTQEAETGSEVLYVNDTVMANCHLGLEILISGILVGEIYSIDYTNSTITLTQSLTESFPVGSLVGGQRKIIKNFQMGYLQGCEIGESKIGATYVAANTITRIYYTNNSDVTKNFCFNIEFLY